MPARARCSKSSAASPSRREGRVTLRGRVASLLEVGTGFHPELTGRENIYLNGAILGMSATGDPRKFDEIVAFAEVERFLDTPVKRYSQRHVCAPRLCRGGASGAGDPVRRRGAGGRRREFQKKCLGKMGDVARSGRTILFVSHNTNAIERLCDRVVVLDKGGVAGIFDDPREGIGFYLGRGVMSTVWMNSGSEFRHNDHFTPQRIEVKSDSCAGAAFPQNHAIILTIDGVVHQSDPALQIGLFIYDEAEQIVFMSWSTDSVEKNWPRLDRGPVRLSVTIPPVVA